MMRGVRLFRGNITDIILIAVFITLAYVFIQRRGYMSKVRKSSFLNGKGHFYLVNV